MSAKTFQRSRAPIKEVKEYEEEVIQIDRVTRVVKGGRRLRFRATVVIGNKKGKVGIGLGKSNEVTGAIQKAINKAKKNIIIVPILDSTIPHDVKVKFKSSKVLLLPASSGTGIIAGGAVRKVLELAGVKNILSKALGSNNRVNNTKATFIALKKLKAISKPQKQTEPVTPKTDSNNQKENRVEAQKKPQEVKKDTNKPQEKSSTK